MRRKLQTLARELRRLESAQGIRLAQWFLRTYATVGPFARHYALELSGVAGAAVCGAGAPLRQHDLIETRAQYLGCGGIYRTPPSSGFSRWRLRQLESRCERR